MGQTSTPSQQAVTFPAGTVLTARHPGALNSITGKVIGAPDDDGLFPVSHATSPGTTSVSMVHPLHVIEVIKAVPAAKDPKRQASVQRAEIITDALKRAEEAINAAQKALREAIAVAEHDYETNVPAIQDLLHSLTYPSQNAFREVSSWNGFLAARRDDSWG